MIHVTVRLDEISQPMIAQCLSSSTAFAFILQTKSFTMTQIQPCFDFDVKRHAMSVGSLLPVEVAASCLKFATTATSVRV